MRQHNKMYLIMFAVLLFIAAFDTVGNSLKTLRVMMENDKLYMVFKNESGQELLFDSGSLALNGQELEKTEIYSMPESDLPLTTLFLVDVTKTVLYSETARITESAEVFRTNPVFSASGRSRYFLQTFGNVVSQVSGPSEEPAILVSGIKYEDNTSDYFYALSEAVDFLKNRIDSGIAEKQQIFIFTDAMRFSETTISESQLKDKLRKAGVPVYGIALYNTNTELVNRDEVNKLLELAEISGGKVLIPKDYSESTVQMTNEIIQDIISCYTASAFVNEEITRTADNNYAVSLTIDYQNNQIADIPYSATLLLPELPTPTPTPEPTEIPTETPEITPTQEISETPEPEENEDDQSEKKWIERETEIGNHKISNKWLLVGGAGLLIIIITAIVIPVSISNQKKKQIEKQKAEALAANQSRVRQKTVIANMVPSIGISLTRVGMPGSVPIQAKLRENQEVKFGRIPATDVVGLDNDETISSVHFKLVYMNGFIYIEDMASSNGVILNGSKLTQRARLNNGDHLLLGRITYQFQVISSNVSVMKRG